jgi:acyl dehydratase
MHERTDGKYYEELEPGDVYEHAPGRTITEFETTMWTVLAMNTQPLHINADAAAKTEFGQRVVPGTLVLSLVLGMQVSDITLGTTVANLGFENVKFHNPTFIGDTIYSETAVLRKRESESRDDSGVVVFEHRGYNQNEELVCTCERPALMLHED